MFFFYDTTSTVIHTYLLILSLHDALPICGHAFCRPCVPVQAQRLQRQDHPCCLQSAGCRELPRRPPGQRAVSLRRDERRVERGLSQGWRELRSEEHTSELQSLMRISYAVFGLKKKNK